jgi:branched-subunit amino acid transport protein
MALWQPELLAAVPTFIFALKTRSLGGTVVVGMLLFWLTGKVL